MQFWQSSEKLAREIAQLDLALGDLHEDDGAREVERPTALRAMSEKPARRALPEHLPREEVMHEAACTCPKYGGAVQAGWEKM